MWSFLVARLTPLLLAATTTNNVYNKPPETALDLSRRLRQTYVDLERPSVIHTNITSTLRFSYVTPPRKEDGSSTWRSGLLDDDLRPDSSKPLAIYLPGLDGAGITASTHQFDDMARTFEFWRLTVLPNDLSTFTEMVGAVVTFIQQMTNTTDEEASATTTRSSSSSSSKTPRRRQVILIGESCGGLIASAVAIRLRNTDVLKGLVLVNPATSFDQTQWANLIPIFTSLTGADTSANGAAAAADAQTLVNGEGNDKQDSSSTNRAPSPYGVFGSLLLAVVIPDPDQLRRVVNTILELPSLRKNGVPLITDASTAQEFLDALADYFSGMEKRLPAALLEHRFQKWLIPGNIVVSEARLRQLQVPTLIVVGREDRLVPSAQEAERLVKIMPNAEKLVVANRGHYVLDENVNLTEAIVFSKLIDPFNRKANKKFDPITDWKPPDRLQIENDAERVAAPMRKAHSPVFFSTDTNGKRWMGLTKVPRPDGPLLFVGNHQFAGIDLILLVSELLQQRNIMARGLAHPVNFFNRSIDEIGGRTPGVQRVDGPAGYIASFQTYGAVMVSPRNFYRLLQTGQDVLLFPGGAKEATRILVDYPLFWPEKIDFVRTAARFNATIIPLSSIGIIDSVRVVVKGEDLMKIPYLKDLAKPTSEIARAARYDETVEDEFSPLPLLAPGLPARNYFLFGKPITTHNLDPKDIESCRKVYEQAQAAVRTGLDDLLRAREQDPFKDPLRRLAYEQLFGKKAPTFSIDALNKQRW